MESIADFYSKDQQISDWKVKYDIQLRLKKKAIAARDREKESNASTVSILINLQKSGRCDLTNQEIADVCFVSKRNVLNLRSLMKKASNEKRT